MSTLEGDDAELDVACYYGGHSTTWTTETLTEGLLAFYDFCPVCYPDDDREPPLGATVLRALFSDGKLLHRPVEIDRDDNELVTDGGQVERTECWNCGYMRPTWEVCPEFGEYGGDEA